MVKRILVAILLGLLAAPAWAQHSEPETAPKPPAQEQRYGNMPEEAVPYRRFSKPYFDWFIQPNTIEYNGAAEDRPDGDVSKLSAIAIGFLGPLEKNPESVFGNPMLHGAQLAIDEANARGGYRGKPFVLKPHNDSALWGASSAELVKMLFDENCWAVLGSIDGQSTHMSIPKTQLSQEEDPAAGPDTPGSATCVSRLFAERQGFTPMNGNSESSEGNASSSGSPLVTVIEASDFRDLDHGSEFRRLNRSRFRRVLTQCQMCARLQIVVEIRPESPS